MHHLCLHSMPRAVSGGNLEFDNTVKKYSGAREVLLLSFYVRLWGVLDTLYFVCYNKINKSSVDDTGGLL